MRSFRDSWLQEITSTLFLPREGNDCGFEIEEGGEKNEERSDESSIEMMGMEMELIYRHGS